MVYLQMGYEADSSPQLPFNRTVDLGDGGVVASGPWAACVLQMDLIMLLQLERFKFKKIIRLIL